tara:strand:+ start:5675 stop:5791 length:117 start_codon:yes stop_codon:yes gene_type:complete
MKEFSFDIGMGWIILIAVILFAGEPDLMDAIIHNLMSR